MIQKNNNWEYNPYIPSTKSVLWTLFVRTLRKILFFRKWKNPMKYNVVRTIILCSTLQNIFIFLDIFARIKLLPSDFSKWFFYLEELSHWAISQIFINQKLWNLWRRLGERPYKNFLRCKICLRQENATSWFLSKSSWCIGGACESQTR